MKLRHLVEIAAIACICWAMTSCTASFGPDGSGTVTIDGEAAVAILADK